MSVNMLPINTIEAKLGLSKDGRARKFFTSACAKAMDKYVPFDTGTLSKYQIVGTYIIYNQPYAHYMYIGKVMGPNIPIKREGVIVGWFSPKNKPKYYTGKDIVYNTSMHAFAGPYWDDRMWSVKKKDIIEQTKREMMRGG